MKWYPYVPYNPKYPLLFSKEKKRMQKVLGNIAVVHFGSTAVPYLGGKGYIDIYIVVNKRDLMKYSKLIQKGLDYEYKPNAGVPNERLFHKHKVDNEVYHLHLTYKGNQNYVKDIAFRDYLIQRPKDAVRYSDIKREASQKANKAKTKEEAKKIYMDTKKDFIQELLGKTHQDKSFPSRSS